MRDSTSALRSVQRWLGEVLGPEWDIQRSRGEPEDRPSGVVRPVAPVSSGGSAYVTTLTQQFEAYFYPVGQEGNTDFAAIEAENTKNLLRRAFTQGAAGGKAFRLPYWDYDGVASDEPLPDEREPITDYIIVRRGVTIEARPDPETDDLWTIVLGFTADWHDHGDLSRFDGSLFDHIEVSPGQP